MFKHMDILLQTWVNMGIPFPVLACLVWRIVNRLDHRAKWAQLWVSYKIILGHSERSVWQVSFDFCNIFRLNLNQSYTKTLNCTRKLSVWPRFF